MAPAIALALGGTTGIGRVIEPFTARDDTTRTLVQSMTDGNATMPHGSLALARGKNSAMATGRGWVSVLAIAPGPRA